MSDSASVYEPDDDAESDSDFQLSEPGSDFEQPRSSIERSPTPNQGLDEYDYHRDPTFNGVGRQIGDALMARIPQMRGSLTFLRAYSHLIVQNSEIIDYASLRAIENTYKVSQHGSMVWTPTEKEVFFNALDRKGKGGIKELAAAIGTKSEPEVMEYIRLLHKALEAQYSSDVHLERMPVLSDVPAATEVSQECCGLLEEYADVLSLKESLLEAQSGTKQHGDHWIITRAHAHDLENEDGSARGDLRLASDLLNLPYWVRLSYCLFMNFGGKQVENNWWNLAKRQDLITAYGHTPSMTADTAVDFYSLAVSVTRRLVQSSLFFAMSRLRSSNRSGNDRKGYVRTQDVRAAIEVLNMKHCRPNFVDIARRNETVLEDINNRKGWVPTVFSYEEAEEIIDKHEWTRYRKDGTMYNENDEEDKDVDHDPLATRESSEPTAPVAPTDELEIDPEEEQADIADQNASHREEANFLKLMEQPVPSVLHEPMKAEEVEDETKQLPERRMREDVSNWRDRTVYRSDWEEYGYDFADLNEDLEMPPLKRPRYNEPAVALSAAVVSGEDKDEDAIDGNEDDEDGSQQGELQPTTGESWVKYYMATFGQPGNPNGPG
ncbi:Pc12g06630 [Penicillium rubens Wisconsin 54-1255]|uniref:Pc12g06630 protein n=1 Tax=Penicillium rubens (strain ATCC 28089 / DSM 1075 / NRRL 1951 / Wisconsin 54-1255) TaxID=500485 RepID=B6H0F7_PENRW|nr:Pc12g06630 [Penicillium rubens Wisconsin 54-1255]